MGIIRTGFTFKVILMILLSSVSIYAEYSKKKVQEYIKRDAWIFKEDIYLIDEKTGKKYISTKKMEEALKKNPEAYARYKKHRKHYMNFYDRKAKKSDIAKIRKEMLKRQIENEKNNPNSKVKSITVSERDSNGKLRTRTISIK